MDGAARKGGGIFSTKGIALLLVRRELSDGSWGKKGELCLNSLFGNDILKQLSRTHFLFFVRNCEYCDNCAENRRKDFIFAAAIFKEDK